MTTPAQAVDRTRILAEMLNEVMPGWEVAEAGVFVRGPGTLGAIVTNRHSDSPKHLDIDFILNIDKPDETTLYDCVNGLSDDFETAVRQAINMWLTTTGDAIISLFGGPGPESMHCSGDDPEGFPGWHTVVSPTTGWMLGDENPITEWIVATCPWHQLAPVIAPEIDRPYLNGIKFFLAGSKDLAQAEVRINGRHSEAASEALTALDWPRPEIIAAGRAYVILVEPDQPEQEGLDPL